MRTNVRMPSVDITGLLKFSQVSKIIHSWMVHVQEVYIPVEI